MYGIKNSNKILIGIAYVLHILIVVISLSLFSHYLHYFLIYHSVIDGIIAAVFLIVTLLVFWDSPAHIRACHHKPDKNQHDS